MPKTPIPEALVEFLQQPNPAVIGTVDADGAPHTAATWYLWDDGRVLVNMADTRKRLHHMRDDPRVSLTVLDKDQWYNQATLRGRVVAIEDDSGLDGINRLSTHYLGNPYGRHEQKRVNALIEIESWYGWSGGAPWAGER
jgi:PPOX class probable F420-dependent enzyme